ncbi:MAG TPA: hypothetical protein VJ011_11485 [Steroidobacteraceae bacterium]|nr:hypothetical protein [Steroidobacteraceae bacterium]
MIQNDAVIFGLLMATLGLLTLAIDLPAIMHRGRRGYHGGLIASFTPARRSRCSATRSEPYGGWLAGQLMRWVAE